MKKKKKKSFKGLIVLTVIITIAGIVLAIINNKKQTILDNMAIIKQSYTNLSVYVSDDRNFRNQLTNRLTTFNNEIYSSEHESYMQLLNAYNNNLKAIEVNINQLASKCDIEYEEATINILCRSYGILYEEVVNGYVTSVTNYNNKITAYNQTSETDYELFTMTYKEYIDYDQDGNYQGK